MFQKFYPDVYMDSTYEIDFEQLYQDGYGALYLILDNTLVTHGLLRIPVPLRCLQN